MSCDNEFIDQDLSTNSRINLISFDNLNNNLVLSSSKSVKDLYSSIKSENKKEINQIKEYYKEGFQPMKLVDNVDEAEIDQFIYRKQLKYKGKSKTLDFEDDVINNDNFASILSDKGEVQVGDSICRYTKKGLLITHIDDRKLLDRNDDLLKKGSSSFTDERVNLYIPNKDELIHFSVTEVDDCGNSTVDIVGAGDEYYGCGSSAGVGYSGGGNTTTTSQHDTSNYNVCVNTKAAWIDNIFGRSYVCEYFFNSDKKLRTVFEAADFYFFQDVYAQAKFKNKTWFGWFSSRDAKEVYLLNKKVILNTKTKKRGFDLAIDWDDAVKAFNKIYSFFLSKPDNTITYISNQYDFKTKITTTHVPNPDNLISYSSNSLNLVTPQTTKKNLY